MSKRKPTIGRIVHGTVRGEARTCAAQQLDGVFRVRSGAVIGAMWWVRGELTHALVVEGGRRDEGLAALRRIAALDSGTYFYELQQLPPTRSIRIPTASILGDEAFWGSAAEESTAAAEVDAERALSTWLTSTQRRVPGLESIGIGDRSALRHTTARAHERRDRLSAQWPLSSATGDSPNLRLLRTEDWLTLAIAERDAVFVLEATPRTAPEALLWAAEDARHALRKQLQTVVAVAKP